MRKTISFLIIFSLIISFLGLYSFAAEGSGLFPAVSVLKDGEKWGYIDDNGKFIIKPEYDFVRDFNLKGIAIAAKGKYQFEDCSVWFIDKSGKAVTGPFISTVPEFANGVAVLNSAQNGSRVVDENGKLLLESKDTFYEYADGLLRFSHKGKDDKTLYGFMDLTGRIVIPAKYSYANQFRDGFAYVSFSNGDSAIIDKKGVVQQTSNEMYVIYSSKAEGLSGYQDKQSRKFGYKNALGKIVIEAKFDQINAFKEGFADVLVNKTEYEPRHGLIDKEGKFIIPPEYSGITYMGNGLYAVSQDFYFTGSDEFSAKAIFDNKGNRLTDFVFYEINTFNGGYASVSDETSTFFIDTNGKVASQLPRLQGIGTMTVNGGIIKAEIDGGLQYFKASGESIWKKDETKPLDDTGTIKVSKIRYRSDYCTYIEYPEISGMSSKAAQDKVNSRLKSLFTDGYKSSKSEGSYTEDITLGYNVEKNKNLLVVEMSGYDYPIGAAHGMPTRDYLYIDLVTGVFYDLSDLFISGSKYTDKLTSLVRRQIELNMKTNKFTSNYNYFDEKPKVSANQGFILSKDSLSLYYTPYELTAYAAGFPEFEIPFGQLADIIYTKGAFWNSFDKTLVKSKVQVINDVEASAVSAVMKLMNAYENGIVNAINSNSFSKVEGTLQKGSKLYNSQKALVQSLYKRGISEKLVEHEIYAIAYDYENKLYRVFVFETIAVKHPGKDFVNKKYSWCYDVQYYNVKGNYRLSGISSW